MGTVSIIRECTDKRRKCEAIFFRMLGSKQEEMGVQCQSPDSGSEGLNRSAADSIGCWTEPCSHVMPRVGELNRRRRLGELAKTCDFLDGVRQIKITKHSVKLSKIDSDNP